MLDSYQMTGKEAGPGPMMEKTLRQALFLTRDSVADLVARPLSTAILILAAAALFGPPFLRLLGRRLATDSGFGC